MDTQRIKEQATKIGNLVLYLKQDGSTITAGIRLAEGEDKEPMEFSNDYKNLEEATRMFDGMAEELDTQEGQMAWMLGFYEMSSPIGMLLMALR